MTIVYNESHLSKKAHIANMQTFSFVLPAVQYLEQYGYLNMLCQPLTQGQQALDFWGAVRDSPVHFLTILKLFASVLLEYLGLVIPGELCYVWEKERNRVMRFLYHHPGLEKETGVSKPSNLCPKPLQNFCGKSSHNPV